MNDLQSLSAYPVGARPEAAIEEITVKGEKSGDARFTFWDFLDVINPLQHIPVVNTIYREITGDEIKAPAKMIGSAIIGGPIGLAVAMVDSIIEDTTGKDMGGHALAMFKNETPASPTAPQPESLAATAATTATTAVAATASAASLGPAPSPREFIPTGRATGATLASLPSGLTLTASFLIEADEDEETVEAQRANQETEAAIAAAAAAAPQGQVFIPLAGRQPASFKSVATEQSQARFLPIDRTGRAASGRTAAARQQLDQAAVAQLQAQGIDQAQITLHVGVGTFRPVEVENINHHAMHVEWIEISPETVAKIHETQSRGGRIIAVGTTVVRALEGAAALGTLQPYQGKVNLFIHPGYPWQVVEGLVTNFHLPRSSLMMLVSALVGRQRLLDLYALAIEHHYRFYSFGDAMVILPEARPSFSA